MHFLYIIDQLFMAKYRESQLTYLSLIAHATCNYNATRVIFIKFQQPQNEAEEEAG